MIRYGNWIKNIKFQLMVFPWIKSSLMGFSLDDKCQEISDNDIPDIIERFNNLGAESDRARTEQSFLFR